MNRMLPYGYRINAWFVDLAAEAVILLCAGILLVPRSLYSKPISARDIAGALFIIASAFFFSGYGITTLIARLLLHGRGLYLYAVLAPLLFLAHFQLLNHLTWGGLFEPDIRFLFRVFGSVMVVAVTTVVSLVLKRAEERTERQPPALPEEGVGGTQGL